MVSGMKRNLILFDNFLYLEKYFIKAIATSGPDNSLLAIEGWQILVEINISFSLFPLINNSP